MTINPDTGTPYRADSQTEMNEEEIAKDLFLAVKLLVASKRFYRATDDLRIKKRILAFWLGKDYFKPFEVLERTYLATLTTPDSRVRFDEACITLQASLFSTQEVQTGFSDVERYMQVFLTTPETAPEFWADEGEA